MRSCQIRDVGYWPPGPDVAIYERVSVDRMFDLPLPPDQAAEGYRAMDERRAIETLLRRGEEDRP